MRLEINNRTKDKINLALVKKITSAFGRAYKVKKKEISLAFVSDAEMKKLNRTYWRVNQPTDILSFAGEKDFLGELVIDYSQIKRQAKEAGESTNRELMFILVHGLLHLVGHDDKTEAGRRKMMKIGEVFIRKLRINELTN